MEDNQGATESDANGKKPNVYQEVPGGYFKQGNPGGGRIPETEESKIKKRAIKEFVEDYKQNLAEALPLISPVLIKKARTGDVSAIKELNDRVMGKATQKIDMDVEGGLVLQTVEKQLKRICGQEFGENSTVSTDLIQDGGGEANDPNGKPMQNIPAHSEENASKNLDERTHEIREVLDGSTSGIDEGKQLSGEMGDSSPV